MASSVLIGALVPGPVTAMGRRNRLLSSMRCSDLSHCRCRWCWCRCRCPCRCLAMMITIHGHPHMQYLVSPPPSAGVCGKPAGRSAPNPAQCHGVSNHPDVSGLQQPRGEAHRRPGGVCLLFLLCLLRGPGPAWRAARGPLRLLGDADDSVQRHKGESRSIYLFFHACSQTHQEHPRV